MERRNVTCGKEHVACLFWQRFVKDSRNVGGSTALAHWDMASVCNSCKYMGSHLNLQDTQDCPQCWMQSVWCEDLKPHKSKARPLINNGGTAFSLVYMGSWGNFVFHWRILTLMLLLEMQEQVVNSSKVWGMFETKSWGKNSFIIA